MNTKDKGRGRVEVTRRGDTVEILQDNYNQTGLFVQVIGRANVDDLIRALRQALEQIP